MKHIEQIYRVEKDVDGETLVIFKDHKDCGCGVAYTTWGNVQENELGYWFDCPVCSSTGLVKKEKDLV